MIRGTTPTLEFVLPFDTSILVNAYVTFEQNGELVLEKTLEDCVCQENMISVKLTQEETLKLTSGSITEIQIRAKTADGDALASNIIRESTGRILKEGVI